MSTFSLIVCSITLLSFTPASSASEQCQRAARLTDYFGSDMFVLSYSLVICTEREPELERRGATHTTKPASKCPAVPLFPDPALVIEAHWLSWGREATIVRGSLLVNPLPPTLSLQSLSNCKPSEVVGAVTMRGSQFCSKVADTLQSGTEAAIRAKRRQDKPTATSEKLGKPAFYNPLLYSSDRMSLFEAKKNAPLQALQPPVVC